VKKLIILFSFFMLTGCGILEEANNSLTYVEEMTDYLNEAEQFANDFPGLVENAAADSSNIPALETRLKDMKTEIQEINDLTPPQLAESIHKKVEGYNEQALEGIDRALVEIDKGEVQISELQNLEIVNTFNQLQEIKGNLENLGQ
jgi:soluble cytochrome b562